MTHFLALLTAGLLLVFSGLHIYWAAGGRWGIDAALPEINGKRAITPPSMVTLFVAVALFAAALVVLGRLGIWGYFMPQWIFFWGIWALAIIFMLRAVGDFRFLGFFKRIHTTKFAYWDTVLFSPLCFLMAMALFFLAHS